MHREGNKIVFDSKPCNNCCEGTKPMVLHCSSCKGTGKGKRGKERGCKACFGFKRAYDQKRRVTCTECNGNYANHLPEGICDYLPDNVFREMEFKVYRHARMLSGNESILGDGCVYSCSGLGCAGIDDADLINRVKAHTGVQATKICQNDGTLADHIGIFVAVDGYSVRAVFNLRQTVATIASERGYEDYLETGARMAAEGRNGTFEALRK